MKVRLRPRRRCKECQIIHRKKILLIDAKKPPKGKRPEKE